MADPSAVVAGIAQLLAASSLGATWDPTGAYPKHAEGWSITDTGIPPAPDQLVVLSLYPGGEEDSRNQWTEPRLQVRTRAGLDPRTARDMDRAVRDVLHGLGNTTLPNGIRLTDCYSLQSAAMPMGADANGRWEFSRNYQLTINEYLEA